MSELRPELPRVSERIRALPVRRGYPVPYFVAWVDENGERAEDGAGEPDFRIMDEKKKLDAIRLRLCWVCGQHLGRFMTFVAGPMCAINGTSAEPPCHYECALFSACACPFLVRPQAKRNDKTKPPGVTEAAGNMIMRNPGVTMLWTTRSYKRFLNGELFSFGEPVRVEWFREGRTATREEVDHSIETGLPLLREEAEKEPGGLVALEKAIRRAQPLLPLREPTLRSSL